MLYLSLVGSCVIANFDGCCVYSNNVVSCNGITSSNNTATCYCDHLCYQFGDCCSDINSTGCFPNSTGIYTINVSCLVSLSLFNSTNCNSSYSTSWYVNIINIIIIFIVM